MSDDPRWGDDPRDREDGSRDLGRGGRGGSDSRERDQVDPRDVFMEHVDLPRGLEREHVHTRDHDYTLPYSQAFTDRSASKDYSGGAAARRGGPTPPPRMPNCEHYHGLV
jgi:hypothetical protein